MDMQWNEEPMDGVDPLTPAPRRARVPRPVFRPQGGNQVFGSIVDYGRMMAGMGGAAQGASLGNMINQTMGAIGEENRSRVAQEREGRRMQHEKDMLLMRLQEMNGGPRGDDMTAQQRAALAVLQLENAAGRRGTVRNRALSILGLR